MSHIVVAFDPGKKGGVAVLGYHTPMADKMPMIGSELDCRTIVKMLLKVKPNLVVIEKVHAMPKQGVSSMFTFGKQYGVLIGIVEGLNIPYQLVTPQAWKKFTLAGTSKDKDAAIQHVKAKYPTVQLVPPRCRTPHDGIADAVCIAEYGLTL